MHLEVLEPDRRSILKKLSQFPSFYLAGGTALALQLGHRQSVDFDLFTDKKITVSFLKKVENVLQGSITPLVNNKNELTIIANDTKITFLFYPFPVINDFVKFEGISLLGVAELGATKAYTIGRRGSLKDYIDLYTIVSTSHASLETIIELADKKFGNSFNDRLFLEQLIYTDDLEDEPITFLATSISRSEIQNYFQSIIGKIKLS
jgi:hypothetical protein